MIYWGYQVVRNSTVGFMVSYLSSVKYLYIVADDSFYCSLQHLILRSSNFKEDNDNSYLVVQAMSSKDHKEVHGNKRHVANTTGIMEQRSKYQNELTKKKRIGDYPKELNR